MVDTVDAYLLLNAAAQLFEKPTSELTDEERQQAIELAGKEQLMQQKILESVEAAAVPVDAAELTKAKEEIAARFPTAEEFIEDLERNGLSEESLTESLGHALRVEKVMEKVASTVSVSDEEITAFYHENREKFDRPELREARHILITINPQYVENSRKAVNARMKKLSAELSKKPDTFADLAMRHSECPTALEGGLLGKLPQGKLYAELDEVLFTMAEGEISGMIESPMGMHILRCDHIHAAGIAPLEEAAPMIREHLLKPRISMAQKQWIKSLFAAEAVQ